MHARLAALALLATLATATSARTEEAAATHWPMFGHDAAHRGLSGVVGAQSPTLNWKSATRRFSGNDYQPSLAEFSPVVGADGAVYFADGEGVVALDADGSLRWVHPLANAAESVALGPDGAIYAGHGNGLAALNPDGSLRWDFAAGLPLQWPIVAPDGRIFASSPAVPKLRGSLGFGVLVAIDPAGRELSRVRVPGGPTATPALSADAGVVVPARECTRWHWIDQELTCIQYRALLYAARPEDPRPHLIFSAGKGPLGEFASPSIGRDGSIYVAGNAGHEIALFGLDAKGRARWALPLSCCGASAPAIGPDGTIYVETLGGGRPLVLHAVAPDGTLRWQASIRGEFGMERRPAVGADGLVYGAVLDGTVHAISPDGSIRWTKTLDPDAIFSAPAISSDGSVILLGSHRRANRFEYDVTVRAIGPGPAQAGGH